MVTENGSVRSVNASGFSQRTGREGDAAVPLADLAGWGCNPVVRGRERCAEDLDANSRDAALSRGLGRSYGDASLPASERDLVCGTPRADRLLEFDAEAGVVRAEAGLSLLDLNAWSLPRGWFTPVTPGTQHVTLGGMVAADVHGKNHHINGCFGEHVTSLRLRVGDGRTLEASDEAERELFRATLGGMGLTGHILEVSARLERVPCPWIQQESERVPDLETLIERLRAESRDWPFTVSWADAQRRGRDLGRGILIKGRWAEAGEAPSEFSYRKPAFSVPFRLPDWFLQPALVRAFNFAQYRWQGAGVRRAIVHPVPFFYPLDVARQWNRLYGRRGFTQYQCVLPVTGSLAPHRRFLDTVAASGRAFLCVIKDCGPQGRGMISFPMPGISYALDLPVGPETPGLVGRLNELVIAGGGRIYLAKDAFTRAEHLRAMDPRIDAWLAVRRAWDPEGRMRSAQSVRLFGDSP